jgi:hypothetical protein
MTHERPELTGAVFEDRAAAARAADRLIERGMAHSDLTQAAWSADGYVLESHAGQRIWRGSAKGAVVGGVIGSVVGTLAAWAIWSDTTLFVLAVIGVALGGVFGTYLGAYAGFVKYRPQLWDQQDWTHLDLDEGQVLVVVASEEQADEARSLLVESGGQPVEPVRPG